MDCCCVTCGVAVCMIDEATPRVMTIFQYIDVCLYLQYFVLLTSLTLVSLFVRRYSSRLLLQ